MTDVYYTQADIDAWRKLHETIVDDILKAHDKTIAQRDDMIVAVRGVIACFKSEEETDHPSCVEYLESVLKKVEGRT